MLVKQVGDLLVLSALLLPFVVPLPVVPRPSSDQPSNAIRIRREVLPENSDSEEAVDTQSDRVQIIEYLLRYGYLLTRSPTDDQLETAVSELQEVLGITVTGFVDEATISATRAPRCAAKDVAHHKRPRRFVLAQSSRWAPEHFKGDHELQLKWFISKYTEDIPKRVIRSQVQKGFELWSKQIVINSLPQMSITFEEATSEDKADITLTWVEAEHGDTFPFDGSGGTNNILAHTFFPDYNVQSRLNGDIHFDDAEKWDMEPESAVFFPYVLAHEIGHALGLQHSKRESAVMHPVYKSTPLSELQLDIDDKCGINWNYVGPSHFCLFVWLMAEIVPLNVSHGSTMIPIDRLGHGSQAQIKGALKNVRIPRCQTSNGVQALTAQRLVKNLQFTTNEAEKYSTIACNFLAGLHVYRGRSNTTLDDSIETEFSAVHEFASDNTKVRRLVRRAERKERRGIHTVLSPEHFTNHFYDKFFAEYLAFKRR
ncbi:unnamed protein product, partial [Mesorhabditis belari]|uniref:Peptidase metallopeptidase domain-containing protein n=1 Tax=Mesorhabditis belari TaxID=2138241 RepID=A0AAF3J1W1_9BILA